MNFKKSLISLVCMAALAACGGGGGGGGGSGGGFPMGAPMAVAATVPEPAPVVEPDPVCSVDLYGDSILAGASTKGTLARKPVDELRRLLPGWTFFDHAISGDSVTLAESRVMNETRRGSLVVLSWGHNDMTLGWDVRAPLGRLIDFMKAEGRTVILTGNIENQNEKAAEYDAAELETAIKHGAAYVSWSERKVSRVDDLHPDQASSDALAADLAAVLKRECK